MDKLPIEIALSISENLTHREKRECALSCRSWCSWFRKNGLFDRVSLQLPELESQNPPAEDAYLPMLDFFQQQNYGHLASSLDIQVVTMKLEDFVRLPGIFPNIKRLKWEGKVCIKTDEERRSFETAVQQWRHIHDINDYSLYHAITSGLLTQRHTADRLESITLVYSPDDELYEFEHHGINTPLHLAQRVRSFTAVNPPYYIALLQNERDNLDAYTTVKFHNLNYYHESNDDAAQDYEAEMEGEAQGYMSEDEFWTQKHDGMLKNQVKSVKHLEVTVDPSNFSNYHVGTWMKYFSDTYPNLVSFTFIYSDSLYLGPLADDIYSAIDFFQERPKLKKYSNQFNPFTQSTLDTMEEFKVALEDLTVFVDKKSLDQFTLLQNSIQKNSLTKLTIQERGKFVDIHGNYGTEMFTFLKKIPQLEEIKIHTLRGSMLQHNPTVIVSLLNSAPQIRSLKAPELMSSPSNNENITVFQPSHLVHLEIAYCQFELSVLGAQKINQVFENIFSNCPLLETFSTKVNVYKKANTDNHPADQNIALVFSFKEQNRMQKIQIESLYETYFKFVVKDKITCYHQKHDEMRRTVPKIDENEVYIQIEASDASIIETTVAYGSP